jgi:lysyl-tRNA synthetase class 2
VNTSPASKISLLRSRAAHLRSVRRFFEARHVLEVDCLALSEAAPIDLHIDVMKVDNRYYLHTSPEYAMKKLLSIGMGDIYQLGHVFRKEEVGPLHNPEFTIIEWYRLGFTFEAMIQETVDLIALFLGDQPVCTLSYADCFKRFLDVDVEQVTNAELLTYTQGLPPTAASWDKDTLLQLLLSTRIEPQLGSQGLFVLTHFPASQAALARTVGAVALRFEVYHQGIELANGYHELSDVKEQEGRLREANAARLLAGKEALPLDYDFLDALRRGLPDCCGVAVGFDRLLQLKHGLNSIHPVLPTVTSSPER